MCIQCHSKVAEGIDTATYTRTSSVEKKRGLDIRAQLSANFPPTCACIRLLRAPFSHGPLTCRLDSFWARLTSGDAGFNIVEIFSRALSFDSPANLHLTKDIIVLKYCRPQEAAGFRQKGKGLDGAGLGRVGNWSRKYKRELIALGRIVLSSYAKRREYTYG